MYKIFKESKSIKWLLQNIPRIDLTPYYQRPGEIWDRKKKQKFIDSILNGFDVPKFYFHFRPEPVENQQQYDYSIIDGKQRIEAICDFVNNDLTLATDFKFFSPELYKSLPDIAGLKFRNLEDDYPFILSEFLSYTLDIVFIDTDEPDKLEEMFLRLNSGEHLTNIEKRNAFGGKLMLEIKRLTETHPFFQFKIKLKNRRCLYEDIALKLLCLEFNSGPCDLTLNAINSFLMTYKECPDNIKHQLSAVDWKLNKLATVFDDNDKLLGVKNMIPIYYLLIDYCDPEDLREFLLEFNYKKALLKNADTLDILSDEAPLLLEFNRYNQQGADKHNSISMRLEIILKFYEIYSRRIRLL